MAVDGSCKQHSRGQAREHGPKIGPATQRPAIPVQSLRSPRARCARNAPAPSLCLQGDYIVRTMRRGALGLVALGMAACATSGESGHRIKPRGSAPEEGQSVTSSAPEPGRPIALPGKFVEDRFLVQQRTAGGTLTLFTDTGGGLFILQDAVKRLHLTTTQVEIEEGGRPREVALLPSFVPGAAGTSLDIFSVRLPVRTPSTAKDFDEADGMLGQAWFKDRVWTFDYPGRRLWLRAPGDLPPHDPAHAVALGFPMSGSGQRKGNFPRIQIKVDGETIDLLFDTGATVHLSDAALLALHDGHPAVRATSFIVRSIFERWRQRHPDWRVIERADELAGGEPLIEVPTIEVAGFTVGPVWFTRRADANFQKWLSQWMDKQVEGALGGSALRYFRVIVDYPNAVAVFEPAGEAAVR